MFEHGRLLHYCVCFAACAAVSHRAVLTLLVSVPALQAGTLRCVSVVKRQHVKCVNMVVSLWQIMHTAAVICCRLNC